ncbi:MAG: TfoX/Sxy family protein [Alphaproteobacteria bacterium]|nr:TfoX/Sxy family protein [Alphaproteobacteria bacterium]
MAVSPEFLEFLKDQLSHFGPVRARRMFGGAGLFRDNLMFGLIAEDTLYLKIDERNRPDYEASGMAPFTYEGKGKKMQMSYYEIPPEVLEDPADLSVWARKAFEAALAATSPSKRRRRPTMGVVGN